MPKYQVKKNQTIRRDGKIHAAGSFIELEEEEAAEMPWAVELAKPKKDESAGDEGGGESTAKGKKEKGGK